MFKKIFVALLVLIIAFLAVVAMQPSDFRVSRSASIAAPAATVFSHVNDLHKWQAWSPWAKLDPNAKISYAGPEAGVGASFAWAGNHEVGEGSMTITESRASEQITFRLDFLKPFAGTNTAVFTFQPEGNQTAVTWTMTGKNNFVGKAVGLFINCDKMVGDSFEKGLAQLKAIAEGALPL
jgi:carbon monoxide dehydrogenase subunit G